MTGDVRWAHGDEVPVFSARCGFRAVGETPTRFGPAIRMLLDL
jgi:hypothetical protein